MEKIKFTKKNTDTIRIRIKDFFQKFSFESFLLTNNVYYSQIKKMTNYAVTDDLRGSTVTSFRNSYTRKMMIKTNHPMRPGAGSVFIEGDIFYFGDHTMIVKKIESHDKMPVSGRKKGELPGISKHFFS
jgi:hypothetical protein